MNTGTRTKLHRLRMAADEFANAMEGFDKDETDPRVARERAMGLVHAINYAYVLLADEVDSAQVWVVD